MFKKLFLPVGILVAVIWSLAAPAAGLFCKEYIGTPAMIVAIFLVSGMQVKFVPVNMIFSNDSYIICEKVASENNELRLYDSVIVKGKKLYDGKIVG